MKLLIMFCNFEPIQVNCNCGNIWIDYIIPIFGSIVGSVLGAFLGFCLAVMHDRNEQNKKDRNEYILLLQNLQQELIGAREEFRDEESIKNSIIKYDGISLIFIPLLEKAFMNITLYKYSDQDSHNNIVKELKDLQILIAQTNNWYSRGIDYWKNNVLEINMSDDLKSKIVLSNSMDCLIQLANGDKILINLFGYFKQTYECLLKFKSSAALIVANINNLDNQVINKGKSKCQTQK